MPSSYTHIIASVGRDDMERRRAVKGMNHNTADIPCEAHLCISILTNNLRSPAVSAQDVYQDNDRVSSRKFYKGILATGYPATEDAGFSSIAIPIEITDFF